MTARSNTSQGFVSAGWTCSCGMWVPNGTSHFCNWPNQQPPFPTTGFVTTIPFPDNLALILAELREIKELLKGQINS